MTSNHPYYNNRVNVVNQYDTYGVQQQFQNNQFKQVAQPQQPIGFSRQMQNLNNYQTLPTDKKNVEVVKPPETVAKTYCFTVDSRNRDRDRYPNPCNFVVRLGDSQSGDACIPREYRQVRWLKLADCIMPQEAWNHQYLIMTINEIPESNAATNDLLGNAFAVLIPERQVGGSNFVRFQINNQSVCFRNDGSLISRLTKMTISIYEPDGTLLSISDVGDDPDADAQILFNFQVSVKESDADSVKAGYHN